MGVCLVGTTDAQITDVLKYQLGSSDETASSATSYASSAAAGVLVATLHTPENSRFYRVRLR